MFDNELLGGEGEEEEKKEKTTFGGCSTRLQGRLCAMILWRYFGVETMAAGMAYSKET